MKLMDRIAEFEKIKLSGMSTSDRIVASRQAKELILEVNEIYKQNSDRGLMDIMKRLTHLKQRIEKRLKWKPTV